MLASAERRKKSDAGPTTTVSKVSRGRGVAQGGRTVEAPQRLLTGYAAQEWKALLELSSHLGVGGGGSEFRAILQGYPVDSHLQPITL